LALGIGTWYWTHLTDTHYSTAVGAVTSVPLDDGSKITLNTASEIHIELTSSERRVSLEKGEAFFAVAKDPKRPFIVHAGNKRIIAVGTQFSVRRSGQDVRVAVAEGKVRIESYGPGGAANPQSAPLAAGSVASTSDSGIVVAQQSLTALQDDLSWRQGYLTFHDISLAEAVAEFNRYNTHRITIDDPKVAAIRISGTFRAVNYEAFVRVLDDGFHIHARTSGDETILARD
jgi:transmembrane sensor